MDGVGTVGIELARSLKRALWYQSERYTDIYIVNVITLIVISPQVSVRLSGSSDDSDHLLGSGPSLIGFHLNSLS